MKLKRILFLSLSLVALLGILVACDEHSHSYDEKWSTNETSHWHADTCGHNTTKD